MQEDVRGMGAATELPHHYIETETSLNQRALRSLKHGDAFAVFDDFGDIGLAHTGPEGIYLNDTRFLSCYELRFEGKRPLLLSSVVQDDNAALSVDLANPDVHADGFISLPRDTISMERTKFLWQAVCYERIGFCNYASNQQRFRVDICFGADFSDLFEIRGSPRKKRGKLTVLITKIGVEFHYEGLDNVNRKTELRFSPAPVQIETNRATFEFALAPKLRRSLFISILCQDQNQPKCIDFSLAFRNRRRDLRAKTSGIATVKSSNDLFNEVCSRAASDLYMLIGRTPQGLYPYAGIPWYSTAFGRDGIITAMLLLWLDPNVAKGVLHFLAATQAKTFDVVADAEPGKILHEARNGEMARLGEVPYRLYYGTVDATPLFIMLAGMYFDRTGEKETLAAVWPNIKAALHWIDFMATKTAMASSNMRDKPKLASSIKAGKIPMTRSFIPMARWRKDRSRFARFRVMSSAPSCMRQSLRVNTANSSSKANCSPKLKLCETISMRRFGVRISAPMPWRLMEKRNLAGCGHRTPGTLCLPASPCQSGRRQSRRRFYAGIHSAAGGSGPSQAARLGTIQSPITMARCGRMTTR